MTPTPYLRHLMLLAVLCSLSACGNPDSPQKTDPSLSNDNQPSVSVKVARVEKHALQAWVYSQGTARSRQREFLTFTQQGIVSHIDPNLRVGSPVKAGQVIAHQAPERITAEFQAAKASLAEAEANLALAEVTRRRYETLIQQNSAAQQEMDEAKVQVQRAKAGRDNAKAQLAQAQLGVNESRLISPIDGVLARLNVEKGRYFMPNTLQTNSEQSALRTVPALVIDPYRFEIRVDLPAYDFRNISTDAIAVIGENSPTGNPSQTDPLTQEQHIEGKVYAISPSLDPQTRTFEVTVHTDSRAPLLQDGEFVAVWIAQRDPIEALSVPMEAVRHRHDQSFVFIADPQSQRVREQVITIGQHSGNWLQVVSGLKLDELVVTDGRAALNDGQQVRILDSASEQP